MKLSSYIIHLFGGWTLDDLNFLDRHCLKYEDGEKIYTLEELNTVSKSAFYAGKEYDSYPQWVNSIQKKPEKHISEKRDNSKHPQQQVRRMAYNGPLGDEIPAYSLRTDKNTSNTTTSKHKNVGKDKKKVRPVKQGGKHK